MVTEDLDTFPYLLTPDMWVERSDQAVTIVGDLYDVTPEVLALCDTLEGHPDWYKRTTIQVCTVSGEIQEVQAYIFTENSWKEVQKDTFHIVGNDWCSRYSN